MTFEIGKTLAYHKSSCTPQVAEHGAKHSHKLANIPTKKVRNPLFQNNKKTSPLSLQIIKETSEINAPILLTP